MPKGEMHEKRRGLNIALALALVALIILFYAVSIVRMGDAATGGGGG